MVKLNWQDPCRECLATKREQMKGCGIIHCYRGRIGFRVEVDENGLEPYRAIKALSNEGINAIPRQDNPELTDK